MNYLEIASNAHKSVNHFYDGANYEVHLQMVLDEFEKYKHNLKDTDLEDVKAACAAHDLIEDCRYNYNDIKKYFNINVADIVFNVTDELGKTRKERHFRTYPKIVNDPKAKFVKLCDRLANAKYSKQTSSSMFETYKSEYLTFRYALKIKGQYEDMWDELDSLLI